MPTLAVPLHRPKLNEGRLTWKGRSTELTRAQYTILKKLLEESPKLVSWQNLYEEIKGVEADERDDKLIKVHIYGLRERLRDAGIEMAIENRRQWGYKVWW